MKMSPTSNDNNFKKEEEPQKGVGGRHLVADDNEINRFVIKTFLEQDGYQIVDVEDGKYVLDLFREGEQFDMVWLDLKMPHTDGVTCCEKLRNDFCFKGPIVGITAHVDDYTLQECQMRGFTAVISKPISRDTIIQCAKDFFFHRNLKFFNAGCRRPICAGLVDLLLE